MDIFISKSVQLCNWFIHFFFYYSTANGKSCEGFSKGKVFAVLGTQTMQAGIDYSPLGLDHICDTTVD